MANLGFFGSLLMAGVNGLSRLQLTIDMVMLPMQWLLQQCPRPVQKFPSVFSSTLE